MKILEEFMLELLVYKQLHHLILIQNFILIQLCSWNRNCKRSWYRNYNYFTDVVSTGTTQAFVPTQNLFLKTCFQLNDEVVYKANGGTPILVWTGVAGNPYVNLDTFSNLFVVPLSQIL